MDEVRHCLADEEYRIWRKNVPFLYDLMYTQALKWPSPCVQWFPSAERSENRATVQKLLMTTFTSGEDVEHLLFASVTFPDMVDEDSLGNADIKFKFSQSIPVDRDINRARYCPLATNIIACRSEGEDVLVYDFTKHSSAGSAGGPDTVLSGHKAGGFALDWNHSRWGQLATGGKDSLINVFDINDGLVSTISSHSDIVNDISYSHFDPNIFCSVSDDLRLILHDTRSGDSATTVDRAHFKSVESCAFSPFKAELLATGSGDSSLKIWDARNVAAPLFTLRGHRDAVVSVKWSPHYESILASCSTDRRVAVWDLNRTDLESDGESPELLFIHGGHTSSVDDLDWNPAEPMEIASVSNDGLLHVWKISLEEYL